MEFMGAKSGDDYYYLLDLSRFRLSIHHVWAYMHEKRDSTSLSTRNGKALHNQCCVDALNRDGTFLLAFIVPQTMQDTRVYFRPRKIIIVPQQR